MTGIYKEGIKQIQKNNLIFVDFKWTRTNDGIIDKLYGKSKNSKNHNHSLVLSLFNQGYSLACVVLATSKFKQLPVTQFLKNLKGPTDPAHHNNTHLRKILGAENRVINYIHTSDTPKAALNELKLFFPDVVKKTTKSTYLPIPKQKYQKSVSVYYAIYGIKFSIYEKFKKTDVKCLEHLFEHEKKISTVRNKNSKMISDLESIYKSQLCIVITNRIFDKKIRDLFELISKIRYTPQCIEKILDMCRELDVDFDKWDEIILRSQGIQGNLNKMCIKCK